MFKHRWRLDRRQLRGDGWKCKRPKDRNQRQGAKIKCLKTKYPFLSQERQRSKSLEQQLRQEKAHLKEVEERSEQRKTSGIRTSGNHFSNFRHALHQALLERLSSAAHLRTERLAAKTERSRWVVLIKNCSTFTFQKEPRWVNSKSCWKASWHGVATRGVEGEDGDE